MSSMFKKPKVETPKQVVAEEPAKVVEDEEDVKRRKRKAVESTGRSQNILSGIQTALKKRLGE